MEIDEYLKRAGIDRELYENQLAAAKRIWQVANSDTGQSEVAARFILGLYNGYNYPFNLTLFRKLDNLLFEDCSLVLRLDIYQIQEIHHHIGKTSAEFDNLAEQWGFLDQFRENLQN